MATDTPIMVDGLLAAVQQALGPLEHRTVRAHCEPHDEWQGLENKVEHIKAGYVMFLRSLTLDRQAWFQQGQ